MADRRARLLRVHDGRRVPACPDGERSEALLARHLLPLPLASLYRLLLRLLPQNRLGHRRLRPRRDRLLVADAAPRVAPAAMRVPAPPAAA